MMNKDILQLLQISKPAGSDEANLTSVAQFATEMYEELEVYDHPGLRDWIDPRSISVREIKALFFAELAKPDVDYAHIANFAMMLWFRGDEELSQRVAG